jgi:hypothetical protein
MESGNGIPAAHAALTENRDGPCANRRRQLGDCDATTKTGHGTEDQERRQKSSRRRRTSWSAEKNLGDTPNKSWALAPGAMETGARRIPSRGRASKSEQENQARFGLERKPAPEILTREESSTKRNSWRQELKIGGKTGRLALGSETCAQELEMEIGGNGADAQAEQEESNPRACPKNHEGEHNTATDRWEMNSGNENETEGQKNKDRNRNKKSFRSRELKGKNGQKQDVKLKFSFELSKIISDLCMSLSSHHLLIIGIKI